MKFAVEKLFERSFGLQFEFDPSDVPDQVGSGEESEVGSGEVI